MQQHVIGDTLFSSQQISAGVTLVAQQLNQRYRGESVVLISVVPGGILFTADLVRQLEFDLAMDYIACPHTPGDSNNQSAIVYQQTINIANRPVIVVDDALESGSTMLRLMTHLTSHYSPRSLAIATLLVKPSRVNIPYPQYYAYELANDDLLVGYGLPWQQRYRNLPFIARLLQSEVEINKKPQ
ncbi:phosphoribosyltransferase [Agarivorans sp.]|uniref:phosphoribosyltransferase n=1 Tax=Agarivorans sp. TaxID=1872412 RepID=UPI003D074205